MQGSAYNTKYLVSNIQNIENKIYCMISVSGALIMGKDTWATHPTKVITAVGEEEEEGEVMGEGHTVQWPTSWKSTLFRNFRNYVCVTSSPAFE